MSVDVCPFQSFTLGPHARVAPDPSAPSVVREVRAFVIGTKDIEEKSGGGADCHSQVRVKEFDCRVFG